MERVWNKIDSQTICWGGEWDDAKSTIKATVFAVMLKLSRDRVKHYISDLYHDATWLNEKLVGPMQFEWVARESGTFIGESANYHRIEDWHEAVKYRFEILVDEKSKWILHIYEAGPIVPEIPRFCEECGTRIAKYVDYMQMWLCSDYCTGLVESRQGRETYTEDDQGNWLQVNVPDSIPNWGTEEVFVGTQEMGAEDPLDVSCIGYKTPSGIEHGSADHDKDNCPVHGFKEIVHSSLPLGLCVLATTAAGCIYHPATIRRETETIDDFITYGNYFPTLRNVNQTRKVKFNMDDILRELREKLDEANSARDEAYDAKSELDDAIGEFDNYIDEVETLINSLDDMPSISVDLDVRVSFES